MRKDEAYRDATEHGLMALAEERAMRLAAEKRATGAEAELARLRATPSPSPASAPSPAGGVREGLSLGAQLNNAALTIRRVKDAYERARYQPGDHPVIPHKIDTLMKELDAALSAPSPAGGGVVDVEALTYRVANAKLGEGPSVRCEGPTDFEKDQARAWVKRVLAALSSPATPEPVRVAFDDLIRLAVDAVNNLDDWTNVNESELTGWGDGEVPPGAVFWRIKSGQALKALRDLASHRHSSNQAVR